MPFCLPCHQILSILTPKRYPTFGGKTELVFTIPARGPMAFPSKGFQNRCCILVAEEDYQRAEEVIAQIDRELYL